MTENKRFTVYGKEIVQGDECWAVAYSEYNADVIATALNELVEENTQLKNKLKFLNELNKPYSKIIEENQRLKAFIKRLTNNCGEIILMNGMGYKVDKILGDFE